MFKDKPDYNIPQAIADKPELCHIEIYYLNEFHILGTERVNGMSVGTIPVTKIRKRAEQILDDDIKTFEEIILSVDRAYIHMATADKDDKSKVIEKYLKGNK